jgi:YVTN family beta-propeller protein
MGRAIDGCGGRGIWLMIFAAVVALASSLAGPDDDAVSPEKAAPTKSPPKSTTTNKPQLRRPVAMVLVEKEHLLLVANRRSGSVSLIDTRAARVVAEYDVAKQLSDLVAVPGGPHLIGLDEAAHRLIVLRRDGRKLEIVGRVKVAHTPVEVQVTADGSKAFVTSLWSRRLSVVDLSPLSQTELGNEKAMLPKVTKVIPLSFAPRKALLVRDDKRLIVADSFGSRLAIFDAAGDKLITTRSLPSHNIRGMATTPDGKKFLIAHQTLNNLSTTNRNDVHWGVLMTNDLRWLVLDNVILPDRDMLDQGHGHPLGDSTSATGDPGEVAIARDGQVVVVLAGTGQVAIGREGDFDLQRIKVGQRPTAVTLSGDGQRAYIANTFSDSISIVDLGERKVTKTISLGTPPKLSLADRGEVLFYDARLSLDGWFSCNSCHVDGHTNGELNDNMSDGSFGASKRILTMRGVGRSGPWAWNGKAASLEGQIRNSARSTMQGPKLTDDQVKALAAYLRSLPPPPSLALATGEVDAASVARGKAVFARQECADCHEPPRYTSADAFDVGLHDTKGNTRFNPPSLLGVSQGGPYFHDNRSGTLDEVFTKHRHQLHGKPTRQEIADLVEFLKTL